MYIINRKEKRKRLIDKKERGIKDEYKFIFLNA